MIIFSWLNVGNIWFMQLIIWCTRLCNTIEVRRKWCLNSEVNCRIVGLDGWECFLESKKCVWPACNLVKFISLIRWIIIYLRASSISCFRRGQNSFDCISVINSDLVELVNLVIRYQFFWYENWCYNGPRFVNGTCKAICKLWDLNMTLQN